MLSQSWRTEWYYFFFVIFHFCLSQEISSADRSSDGCCCWWYPNGLHKCLFNKITRNCTKHRSEFITARKCVWRSTRRKIWKNESTKPRGAWWSLLAFRASPHRKALATLILLTVWEIWNERNARVFHNKSAPSFVILDKIKSEARLWVLAGAKKLGSIMPGE
jgi:hypothetical protein